MRDIIGFTISPLGYLGSGGLLLTVVCKGLQEVDKRVLLISGLGGIMIG